MPQPPTIGLASLQRGHGETCPGCSPTRASYKTDASPLRQNWMCHGLVSVRIPGDQNVLHTISRRCYNTGEREGRGGGYASSATYSCMLLKRRAKGTYRRRDGVQRYCTVEGFEGEEHCGYGTSRDGLLSHGVIMRLKTFTKRKTHGSSLYTMYPRNA